LVTYQQLCDAVDAAPYFNVETDVKFNLFTRDAPFPTQIFVDDWSVLASTTFNAANPTRVAIHGWNGGPDSAVIAYTPQAYLDNGDFNVITVDWKEGNLIEKTLSS
jgi:predicted alpha/beta-fold hydrolase